MTFYLHEYAEQMREIDPTGKLPPYRQVAQIIAEKIAAGELPPGSRIPTESEIVATYGVARSTARRAVARLRDQNLIETIPTRGSYVL